MLALALLGLTALDGCTVIKGIFEAGVGVGILAVVVVVAVLGGGAALLSRKK